MYKGKTFLAVIPARGGSKGIPDKNIVKIEDKPLIQYSIDAAKASKYIDRLIVSTDSERIAKVATDCGADVPFLRPEYLSTDSAKTIDALIHVKETLAAKGEFYDYLVLLQPTQPLRTSIHIDEAIEAIIKNEESSLVSLSPVEEHPILMRTISADTGIVENLLKTNSTVRRQEFPEFYKVNGSIYINKLDDTFNETVSLNDNKLPYIIDSKYDVDIDEPFDLEIFKLKLREIKE